MKIGNKTFNVHSQTYIVGILNITPDSFYDGGRYDTLDKILAHTEKMINDGADIIDIGGMSTKPGHDIISCEEEMQRVVPVIQEIRRRFALPLSIDTYRSEVARAAIDAGADMVNDIWGTLYDKGEMAKTINQSGVPCCLVHNSQSLVTKTEDVLIGLQRCIDHAVSCGIDTSRIILDPGIGFAKETQLNLRLIKDIARFGELGYALLLGASRKSVIGYALNLPGEERLEGTLAVTAYALLKTHIAFLRVHDVKENVRVRDMIYAIQNA